MVAARETFICELLFKMMVVSVRRKKVQLYYDYNNDQCDNETKEEEDEDEEPTHNSSNYPFSSEINQKHFCG